MIASVEAARNVKCLSSCFICCNSAVRHLFRHHTISTVTNNLGLETPNPRRNIVDLLGASAAMKFHHRAKNHSFGSQSQQAAILQWRQNTKILVHFTSYIYVKKLKMSNLIYSPPLRFLSELKCCYEMLNSIIY